MESGMLSNFFKTSMMLRGQPNITTEEYLQLVKQVKKRGSERYGIISRK